MRCVEGTKISLQNAVNRWLAADWPIGGQQLFLQ
jgi:hypothetical protein